MAHKIDVVQVWNDQYQAQCSCGWSGNQVSHPTAITEGNEHKLGY